MAGSTSVAMCGLTLRRILLAFRIRRMGTGLASPQRTQTELSTRQEIAMKNEYDVIVIGSGVAGALTAWKLAQLGNYKILILEAGANGITAGQRLEFHHEMDTQGNRGDPFAPYKDLESRKYVPAAESSQRELADQKN